MRLQDIIQPSTRKRISRWWRVMMFAIAAITIGAIVVDYGFVLDEQEMTIIHKIYDIAWWVYIVSFTLQLIISLRQINRKSALLTIIFGVLLYLSILPRYVGLSESWMWLGWLWQLLDSKFFLIALLGALSLIEISRGVVSFINKKTNPALLMAACFAVIIVFGALLLLLPRSTLEHIRLPVVDALFVSTSAVCVTGLSPVDVAQTFSLEGQIVIMLLIQIGGLGVMTITSFFAMFFMGGTGLMSQFALRDMVGSDTFSSLISTLLYILGFTFVIEFFGALFLWLTIHGTMGMSIEQELFFSLFHAVSAFCNAGFSTLTGNLGNPLLMEGHSGFYLIISVLIVLGGIGFPILANFKRVLGYYLKVLVGRISHKEQKQPRYIHLTNINTKIVLVMTSALILIGTIVIAILEWDGAFAEMNVWNKIVHSIFNAVTPRTAGFNSVDPTNFSILTLIIIAVLMWIGGGSQSTAGGIKVNTLAVALSNLRAVVRGRNTTTLFNRELSNYSVRRASATIIGSLLTIFIFFVLLVMMEPELSPRGLLFETISAIGTVGLSLNITPLLGADSKVLLSVLMFVGRVGMITVLMSFVSNSAAPKYRLPKDNVIIN